MLADAYYNDDEEYEEKAQMWTVEHATKKTFEEMKKVKLFIQGIML